MFKNNPCFAHQTLETFSVHKVLLFAYNFIGLWNKQLEIDLFLSLSAPSVENTAHRESMELRKGQLPPKPLPFVCPTPTPTPDNNL